MIITHTRNAQGQCRVYLGGKGSLECWIEPAGDNGAWRFQFEASVTGRALDMQQMRAWATYTLLRLADALGVRPEQLAGTPFEAIAALHTADAYANRRAPAGRRRNLDQAFIAADPGMRQPQATRSDNERPFGKTL